MAVTLTAPQSKFLRLQTKFGAMIGGVGSGKSYAGAQWANAKVHDEPDTWGLIGANTYRQLHNATLNTFFQVMAAQGLECKYNEKHGFCEVAGRVIHCVSLDNFNVHRGIEIGWGWIDETRDTASDAWNVLIGRLRCTKAKRLEMRCTTTPSGFDWLFDRFNPSGELHNDEYEMVNATSHSNQANLPAGYLKTLESSYDPMVYRQEVLGEMLNIQAGRIYYAFDRKRHASKPVLYHGGYPVSIGMDFNVNPMTAIAFQIINGRIRVIKEFWLMSSNTTEMGLSIASIYGLGLPIIPDSTGDQLHASGVGKSSHKILKDMGFDVRKHTNPFRMDRFNCVNNLFTRDMIEIDPSCKHLIADLEKVMYKKGTTEPETKDKLLTHISDALGYPCWYHFPLIKPNSGVYSIPR